MLLKGSQALLITPDKVSVNFKTLKWLEAMVLDRGQKILIL
jgi:hypothetical protein